MNFCVVNLGCKVNRVESDEAAAMLDEVALRTSESEADVVVVNTCTVTGDAEKKTRKAVRHALRANDHSKVIVTGCAAAIDPDFYRGLDPRIEVVSKKDLENSISNVLGEKAPIRSLRVGKGFNTRVGVKVQDGCDHACTYCIVHVARGPARSIPFSRIVRECKNLAESGVPEIVLTGIDLGSYCCENNGETINLSKLLDILLVETKCSAKTEGPAPRFRLSSIEPRNIDDRLIELLASSNGRICRHLHLPLQSGSTKVLREMARPYTAEQFSELVAKIREAVPQLSLSTDIIVGFPGESENDFEETLNLAKQCSFSKIHVFPYSKREGTPAAARKDQVPHGVKTQRAAELRKLSEELRERDYASRIGTTEFIAVEGPDVATTESYYEITPPEGALSGSLVEAEIPPMNRASNMDA